MKKYRITATMLICLLSLSLFSCINSGGGENLPLEDNTKVEDTTDTEKVEDADDTSTVVDSTDIPTFEVLTDPAIPSEEDIMRVFAHASEIWNKIHISSLDAVWNTPTENFSVTYQGTRYSPARDYATKAALEARFRECFSKRLTQHKLEQMFDYQYCEIDGRLYVTPGDRGTDMRADAARVEYEIISDSEIKVTRFVNVRECTIVNGYDDMWYCAGVSPQEMMLIYEDGRWVFDNFFVCDDLSGYDNGEGIYYEHAKEITEAFIIAEQLAAHFTGHTAAYTDGDSFEAVDENGFTQKYTPYGLASSLSELHSLLEEVFTPELADEFMNKTVSGLPLFTERDGKLYKFGGYFGLYSFDSVNRAVEGYTDNGDGSVSITVSIWDRHEFGQDVDTTWTYTAVLGEDGKYRFTGEFELPIQLAERAVTNP